MIMDNDEKRIAKVLGVHEVPEVSRNSLLKYRQYLLARLDKDAVLTGREDFPWEEKYILGYGNPAEYEQQKKKNPSYSDEYKLIDISEEYLDDSDLIARVVRISDKKKFDVGLSWLTTKDEENIDFLLLDDFATWVVNWC